MITRLIFRNLMFTKGWIGEKLVAYALKECFSKETVILNDIYFHNGKRSCQIDHLVVSLDGIFVIETKSYLGMVYGNADDKYVYRSVLNMNYKTYNPAKQNERHIEYLRENFPIIASKADALHSIVVFVDFSKLKLRNNHGNIGTLWQLPRMIQRFSTPSLSKKDCDAIVKEIEFYNRRKRY